MEKTDTDWKTGGAVSMVLAIIVVIIMASTIRDGRNLVSFFGLFVFLGLTWLFSWKPSKVKLRPVIGALFIQFIFGYVVIRTKWGFNAIEFLGDTFVTLLVRQFLETMSDTHYYSSLELHDSRIIVCLLLVSRRTFV